MRLKTACGIALVAAFAAACTDRAPDELDTVPAEDLAPPPAPVDDMVLATAEFEGTDGTAAPVQGTAELRRQNGTGALELMVRLTGLPGDAHAWHIHSGGCDDVGPVVVSLSNAPQDGVAGDLAPDNGIAERTVTIGSEHVAVLSANRTHSINVHEGSSDAAGASIACATLDVPTDLWGPGVQADVPAPEGGI